MGVREAFEVLYSPTKAFKKIIEKPDFKGVLLILVLVIASMVVVEYVAVSKFFLETRTPSEENWTESPTPSEENWVSNGQLSSDFTDHKVGNYSVKSFISNGTNIRINKTEVGPFDCSKVTGYKELFFWIKWRHSNEVQSFDATLRLFSGSETSYFELDLTDLMSNLNGEWKNAIIPLGPESQGWDPKDSDWKSITGLEFRFAFLTSANLTLKIDGLYFRKYVSPIETGAFSGTIISILMSAGVAFSMNWMLWASILLMITKVSREEVGQWSVFFVIIGHVFSVQLVYALASAALLSTLPALNLPLEVDLSVSIHEMWQPYLAYRVWRYFLPFVPEVWTASLCAIAIRFLYGTTWRKAVSISLISFIIRFVLKFFFGI